MRMEKEGLGFYSTSDCMDTCIASIHDHVHPQSLDNGLSIKKKEFGAIFQQWA